MSAILSPVAAWERLAAQRHRRGIRGCAGGIDRCLPSCLSLTAMNQRLSGSEPVERMPLGGGYCRSSCGREPVHDVVHDEQHREWVVNGRIRIRPASPFGLPD